MSRRKPWLQSLDLPRIEAALREAERRTSAELRVSVAPLFWGGIERAAEQAFARLGMANTREHNGVLVFIVPARRRFVILGDVGIHARAGQELWDSAAGVLRRHFARGDFTEGLVQAIGELGDALAVYFPIQPGDVNELPDAVDVAPPPG